MTRSRVAVVSVGAFGVVCALVAAAGYWWANTTPGRPPSVARDAVFLWAPHTGLPGPRRGWWVGCAMENGSISCRLSNIDGAPIFAGRFLPFRTETYVPRDGLRIDRAKTERSTKLWIGHALVPMVYLEDGTILIPEAAYDEGTRELLNRRARAAKVQ